MNYQHLKNFITTKIRQNDIYIPSMILYLVRNDGEGSIEQIARLLYIFEHKHSLEHYETVVEKFTGRLLEDYNLVYREEDRFILRTWPLNSDEISDITYRCSKVSNGFFTNLERVKLTQS